MSIVSNEPTNTNPNDQKEFSGVVRIEPGKIRSHVDELVRSTVEETLNSMLDAEADDLRGAGRYERSPDRVGTRAGHYQRKLVTKAGQVKLDVRRLRKLPFATEIIERCK